MEIVFPTEIENAFVFVSVNLLELLVGLGSQNPSSGEYLVITAQ